MTICGCSSKYAPSFYDVGNSRFLVLDLPQHDVDPRCFHVSLQQIQHDRHSRVLMGLHMSARRTRA